MASSAAPQARSTLPATQKRPDIIKLAKTLKGVPMCEEYEKMISGMLYDPFTPVFHKIRHRCRGLMMDFNLFNIKSTTVETWNEKRFMILQSMLGKVGKNTFVEAPFSADYGCNVSIGEDCFINWNMSILDASLVVIGDRVMFGPNVSIVTAAHDTSVLSRQKQVEFGHPVFIGNDCWIGSNVTILPGVEIGEGTTIGAGSVVVKDIPAYTVAYGNPCRPRRKLQTLKEELVDPKNPYVKLKTPAHY
ncbi:hypothetical protein GJ744_007379 [Endocarpon pusillum]|uniref:Maltose/galactoside acetyltransferase domain-containing protein n=1 Tax=Endocarpon pusillum TaxID=364733 RepID=A0A8H7AIS7_9EURO|nr:hypothetical protein GJ744_007379 [Endocarpon pusillum]